MRAVSSEQVLNKVKPEMLKKFAETYKPLTDALIVPVDLFYGGGAGKPIGLQFNSQRNVTGGEAGSAAEASVAGRGGLQVGDRVRSINKSYEVASSEAELTAELAKLELKGKDKPGKVRILSPCSSPCLPVV